MLFRLSTLSLTFLLLAVALCKAQQPIASITLHGLDAGRNDHDSLLVLINELITVRTVALHPFIYFSERGTFLQDRYRNWRIGTNEPLPLRLNRRLLDTVAARMQSSPGEQIRLIASASRDPLSQQLARNRCDTVRAALVERGVDNARIATSVTIVPPGSSSSSGRTTLRSVQLAGSPNLLGPMTAFDTLRSYSSAGVRYRMTFNVDSIRRWHLTGTIKDRTYRLLGSDIAQTVLSDNIPAGEAERMAEAGEIGVTLEVTLPDSTLYTTARETLPVQTVVLSRRSFRFPPDEPTSVDHLLLFPADSATLTPATLEALADLKQSIPQGSRVIVTGYSDSTEGTGDGARRNLALERARRVAEQLRSFNPVYDGADGSPEGMPTGTPEGRAFTRVVRLIVAPPETTERR